jgi:hypothetical protein
MLTASIEMPSTVATASRIRINKRRQLRLLEDHGDVRARRRKPGAADNCDSTAEQLETGGVLPLRVRVRKVAADIAGRRGAENRVGQRMTQDIAV